MALKDLFKKMDDNSQQGEMSFVDHLEALRWHIVRSLVAVLIGTVFAYIKMSFFFDKIIMGPAHKDFWTYRALCSIGHKIGLGNAMCLEDINIKLQSTEMSSQFMMSFTIAFVIGFIIAFPYIFWQFWKFVRPALKPNEMKKTRGIIFWVSLLFFVGVAFGYFVISPYTVNFFAAFTLSPLIENKFMVSDYVDTITQLVLGTGIVFQLPLVVYFLAKVGLITAAFLRTYRKYAVVVILIVAAVITPPDVVSQLVVTLPLWGLYEISIGIAARVEKDRKKKEAEWS
jgi:sec-independent protein translocase protein TatC